MRTERPTGNFEPLEEELFRVADWKAGPHTVLTQVDELLAEHDLEIVMIDMRTDEYVFRIAPRLSEGATR
jgi:hypothetical protein